MTVMRRASEGENIFKPHRKHIYQMLNYVWHIPQRTIALLQLGISVVYLQIEDPLSRIAYSLCITGTLTALYFILMMASENRRRHIEVQRRRGQERNTLGIRKRRRRKKRKEEAPATRHVTQDYPEKVAGFNDNWN